MRHFHLARRAGVPALAAVFGALVAGPALADATVSPTTAVQGSGENLTFHVTNTGTAPIQTVTLSIPADTPVAEVYPLSVDDWAPKIQMRTLATPLATIHGGTPATESAGSITWLAVQGHQLAPGKSADLSVAIGPLPTLSTMQFTITSTYANGAAGPTMPPVSLALAPGTGLPATGHDHGGTATDPNTAADGTTGSSAEDEAFAKTVADATRGPSIWSIGGWVVAALALLAAAFYFLRGRHRANEDDEPDDRPEDQPETTATASDDEKEPVTAGKWSLRS
ncbi:DUF1775 domain-containing protein [Actinoplanes sp. NPDC051513]|uniref:DUF1775 domain-containing protein n=1 Tax=Actinoplanes sp. NPDC051513 TaxID=3363908 RepID=UPI0037A75EC2